MRMTFYEEIVTEDAVDIYSRIAYFYNGYTHKWYVNDKRDVFCVCRGKRGPETPFFYSMFYKGHVVKFYAYSGGDFYVTGSGPEWMKSVGYYIEDDMSVDMKAEIIETMKNLFTSDVFYWKGYDVDELNFVEEQSPSAFT